MYNNRTYYIVPFGDVTQAMIDECLEQSIDHLRHSIVAPDRVVLKTAEDTPTPAILSGYPSYTHEQILAEMQTVDWTDPNEGE